MVLLQNKLNLKVTQKQILTPGLVQMVSVLALNKLELKDMINAEIVENPVLDELDENVPLIDEVAGKEADRERPKEEEHEQLPEEKDPFDEVDFGSYFQNYLDPGFRSPGDYENSERPSFENFISKPGTLTDHLMWQLGAEDVDEAVREAAELVIGNLNEDGYLIASDEELMRFAIGEPPPQQLPAEPAADSEAAEAPAVNGVEGNGELLAEANGELPELSETADADDLDILDSEATSPKIFSINASPHSDRWNGAAQSLPSASEHHNSAVAVMPLRNSELESKPAVHFTAENLQRAIALVRQFDPIGVAARDLRDCLLLQLQYLRLQLQPRGKTELANGKAAQLAAVQDAIAIVDTQLKSLQNKQYKDISRAIARPVEAVMTAIDLIRTLDPKPGQRYNKIEPRLIEPDVAFVKQGDEYVVMMNEDDIPVLRLNPAYKKFLQRDSAEKDVRTYVKERYKSAIQLIKNIEQRKQTILRTCYAIINRQRDFLDFGIDHLRPMMIKEVAEEIGVHPSTVSRAVANKYVHTSQGVYELRYFFSESVNGPEGGGTSLMILKRRVKKLIEEEDPTKPLTDDQITRILQSQGIQVTRRTVAKYREDMKIPSTHQRRVKK
jgi:RNA polymerase sigma-54 factor